MNLGKIKTSLAMAAVLVAAGCASMSVSTIRYPNVPDYPQTAPAAVQILRSEPARPHQALAEINVASAPNSPDLDEKLRAAGARIGADAVVIIADPQQPSKVASRSWWSGGTSGNNLTDVIGIAIKYR